MRVAGKATTVALVAANKPSNNATCVSVRGNNTPLTMQCSAMYPIASKMSPYEMCATARRENHARKRTHGVSRCANDSGDSCVKRPYHGEPDD